jgi:transposase
VDTIANAAEDGRRHRRKHSPEFKAHVVAACCKPGVSMASVALANGVNANLVRRWVVDSETDVGKRGVRVAAVANPPAPPAAKFLALPLPSTALAADIRIELQRGATKIVVTWPSSAASECAAWMRELLQ